MKVATVLFAYHRSSHTKKVIDGLRENYVLPEKLFVFQDGMKEGEDRTEWDKVNALIHDIDFCPTELFVSKKNKGLANSVIAGINRVFEEYDAAIILEDDCVPSRNFINFMLQCFERYEIEKQVYCISGYAWPMELDPQDQSDVYFTGRTSSWGWGTWRDRWKHFSVDNGIAKRISSDKELSMYLAAWGKDLPDMLSYNMYGKVDSWAVYWSLTVIEKRGLCVAPYRSLIQNIGCDGAGTHCGTTLRFHTSLENLGRYTYRLPKHPAIHRETQKAFLRLYGSDTLLQDDSSLEHVLVYGVGKFFLKNEKDICENFYIDGFIDKEKCGYYAGKPIMSPDKIANPTEKKILIALADEYEGNKVANVLVSSYRIPVKNVILARTKLLYEMVDA